MTSVRGQDRPARRNQASEAPIGPLSSNEDHEDPLRSNEPGPSEAPARSETPEAPIETPEVPLPAPLAPEVARYTQKDMDHLLRTFFQASKGGPGDKFKAKTPDVYRGKSLMECYNFCQQYEDHFVTCRATGPNRIPFAASFLRDRINFHWQQHKRKLEAESSFPIS